MIIFKYTSNQKAIGRVRDHIKANMLALKLFKDDMSVTFKSQGRVFGGAFRLPDIMKAGGVRLVEVGTTNRTRARDFEKAIGEQTALMLRVHTSNYRIVGFTKEVGLDELVELGRRKGLPVADDIGSGALAEWEGFHGEPTVAQSLRTGAEAAVWK